MTPAPPTALGRTTAPRPRRTSPPRRAPRSFGPPARPPGRSAAPPPAPASRSTVLPRGLGNVHLVAVGEAPQAFGPVPVADEVVEGRQQRGVRHPVLIEPGDHVAVDPPLLGSALDPHRAGPASRTASAPATAAYPHRPDRTRRACSTGPGTGSAPRC